MRITNVGLYSSDQSGDYNEAINFSLRDADPSARYMIRTIIGMDAEEIVPKFYGFGLYTKPRFYDFGLKARELVFRIILNPRFRIDESYSDIRDELYRIISATRTGLLAVHFNSGATVVTRIFGFITKFEVSYFTQTPEVQITMRCDDPMFRGLNPVVYEPAKLATTNPVIIGDSISTAPHGFSMQVTFDATSASFTIQDVATNPEWKFKVIPSGGFLSGDVLYFSSDYSNKHLYMIRSGVTTHLLDRIELNSVWPILFPGINEFHFVDIANFNWNTLEYYPAYWGCSMELFKFNFATDPSILERGEAINGAKSVMWTERYLEPGEFELTSPLSSGLMEFLPLGTFISHTDTYEVMIVENHEIKEEKDKDAELIITGRSLESILDQRMIGMTLARSSSTVREYILGIGYTWLQALYMINDHIFNSGFSTDNIGNIQATQSVAPPGTSEARTINRGSVHKAVMDILEVDDCGIKSIRRNTFGVVGSSTHTLLHIHRGVNKSASVIFSWKGGDLDAAEYLFSDKKNKNSALVVGRYIFKVVDTAGLTGINRRVMIVDADDIDGHLTVVPTGATLTSVLASMTVRGQQALKAQKRVTISRTDMSDVTKYQYRRDYNIGDLVSLDGNFGQIAVMRVIEYVEIEDENGESGHPTLSVPGE